MKASNSTVSAGQATRHRPTVSPTSTRWWFPSEDVRTELFDESSRREQHPVFGSVELLDLRIGARHEAGFATRHPDVDALRGLLGLDWRRTDRLYEEDELVAPEPIDPYHRVDVRDSSRRLRISLDDVILAESAAPRMLFETTARPRFYLTADEVRTELLEPSALRTGCQYKGMAEYFHVRVGGRLVEDLVWRYPDPREDGRRIAGRFCIHHERCHTEVDGRRQHA